MTEPLEPTSTPEAVRRVVAAGVEFRCATPLDVNVPPHGWLPMGDPRVTILLDQVVGFRLSVDQFWDVCRALTLIDSLVSTREIFDGGAANGGGR
ncbi:MAG: hypothetical protein ACM3PV_11865 [Betaproteobacteria bacterium]